MTLPSVKHYLFVFFSIVILSSCEKIEESQDVRSAGWKLLNGPDTIYFQPSEGLFELHRPRRPWGSGTIPELASGTYKYSLSPDSIKLRWVNSSSLLQYQYYYKAEGDKFTIGNFYQAANGLGDFLTFEKISK